MIWTSSELNMTLINQSAIYIRILVMELIIEYQHGTSTCNMEQKNLF